MTLAVAAHAMAGGAVPPSAAAVLLIVLAVTVGAVAATTDRAAEASRCWPCSPWVNGRAFDAGRRRSYPCHGSGGPPAPVMLAAHAVALVAGVALIAAGDRLCRALSSAMRGLAARSRAK